MEIEILKKDGKEIYTVKFIKNNEIFIVGVGDIVYHYGSDKVKIIKIKPTLSDSKFVYNYRILSDILTKKMIDDWQKHDAAFSNITKIVRYTKENKKVFRHWWIKERKRRKSLPKFKVKIKYPDSDYKVGEIIKAYDKNFQLDKEIFKYCKKYPKIFKQI